MLVQTSRGVSVSPHIAARRRGVLTGNKRGRMCGVSRQCLICQEQSMYVCVLSHLVQAVECKQTSIFLQGCSLAGLLASLLLTLLLLQSCVLGGGRRCVRGGEKIMRYKRSPRK